MTVKLFGKKKTPEVQENTYDIFGGFTVTKKLAGYEITWRSPNLTTITVYSPPVIDEDVQVEREGENTRILSMSCKLKLTTKEGNTEARISKI